MRVVSLSQSVDLLKKPGSIAVIPTDTVYGLVARAQDETAVRRLYKLKDRHLKPGTVIAANIDQLVSLGLKKRYLKAVEQFWPGQVSIVIPHQISYLSQGLASQPFRLSADKILNKLLIKTGPLLTSSANLPGQPPAATVDQAYNYFKDQIDFYVDGGNLAGHQPSTIIRVVDDVVEVLRQGAVKIKGDLANYDIK